MESHIAYSAAETKIITLNNFQHENEINHKQKSRKEIQHNCPGACEHQEIRRQYSHKHHPEIS